MAGSPGELLSRRCVSLMKSALRPDMWPRAELKLQWFDKLLMTVVRWHMTQSVIMYLHEAEAMFRKDTFVLVLVTFLFCDSALDFPEINVSRPVMAFPFIFPR